MSPLARMAERRSIALLCLALTVARCGPARAEASPPALAPPLLCRFQTVSVGQFHGLDYGPGVPSGSSTVLLAASPDDARARRAAMIARDGASVARIVPSEEQTLFVATDTDGGSTVVTIFRRDGGGPMPATVSRQRTVGTTPLLVQGAGSCAPRPG